MKSYRARHKTVKAKDIQKGDFLVREWPGLEPSYYKVYAKRFRHDWDGDTTILNAVDQEGIHSLGYDIEFWSEDDIVILPGKRT